MYLRVFSLRVFPVYWSHVIILLTSITSPGLILESPELADLWSSRLVAAFVNGFFLYGLARASKRFRMQSGKYNDFGSRLAGQ